MAKNLLTAAKNRLRASGPRYELVPTTSKRKSGSHTNQPRVRVKFSHRGDASDDPSQGTMRCVARCFSCCTSDAVDDPDESFEGQTELQRDPSGSKSGARSMRPSPDEPMRVSPETDATRSGYSRSNASVAGPRFDRLPDSPWLVQRSPEYGGKLFWTHETSRETTWKQPLPCTSALPTDINVHQGLRAMALVASQQRFYGAPADPADPSARTGICGMPPSAAALRKTLELLSREHALYPSAFLERVGLKRLLLCEDLHYNGQRRRDVPDLASGTLYIDVGDRPTRRKRHSFHHELWHMVDYHLLGNQFEAHDATWSEHNPPGFRYGNGGKHMRGDSKSSQLSSAPSDEFLNRYSTSSVAEDKAEIWATLMCYQQVLHSPSLQQKAGILKSRAKILCSDLNDVWWQHVRETQLKQSDHWEVHSAEQGGGQFWFNWVTGERRWTKPEGTS